MNVCVVGLWHLGTVTAACLAGGGHNIIGFDFDTHTVAQLQQGEPPIAEPGLAALVQRGLADGQLRFTTDHATALADVEIVWIAYDTPVDDDDRADVGFVMDQVRQLFPHLPAGALVLISAQLPVGSTRALEAEYAAAEPGKPISWGYSPENLRLGKAISVFTDPDRVVVGLRNPDDHERVTRLLAPFTERIEWMGVESAEMTKHALNAFLATSVTFINEIATLCEQVGADAKEVERGLKSEARIGLRAYLGPGSAFAGGTLARDVVFLTAIGEQHGQPTHLLRAVKASNAAHMQWAQQRLAALLGQLRGQHIAVWGLTYKPGTNTLRRSSALELCRWLVAQGAVVHAHDPAVSVLPAELADIITLHETPQAALQNVAALVVATEWPLYQTVSVAEVVATMDTAVVVDANRFLSKTLGSAAEIRYASVGKAQV